MTVKSGKKNIKLDMKDRWDGPKLKTKDEFRAFAMNVDRFEEYCERCLAVVPEGGQELIPFVLNPIQRYVWRKWIYPKYKAGQPIRLAVLKMRQSGMSTLFEAFTFWCVLGHTHWNARVIAKKREQSELVFQMFKRFYKYLPREDCSGMPEYMVSNMTKGMINFSKPDERVRKYDPLKYSWLMDMDSKVGVDSAEDEYDLGRAGTYQTIHASEVAFWPRLKGSLSALLQCVHERPETGVFLETTANGENEFFDFWNNDAFEGKEIESSWQKLFMPWYWDGKYELEVPDLVHRFLDDYEETLYNRILDDKTLVEIEGAEVSEERIWAKIFWRRKTIRDKFLGDLDLFNQEFPSTQTEAFMSSGSCVWSNQSIQKLDAGVKPPKWVGNFSVSFSRTESTTKRDLVAGSRLLLGLETKMMEHDRGRFKVWEEPQPADQYLITVDVAEGKAIEGISEERSKLDFSVVQILKLVPFPPLEQVAVWHGTIAPHELGYLAAAIGCWYNVGLLSWEVNSIGIALGVSILDHLRYPNVWMRQEVDTLTQHTTMKPGWRTSSRTKPRMVSDGIMFVSEGQLVVHDVGTLNEMKSFCRLGDGKFGASRGHDDRVMSLLQACVIAQDVVDAANRTAKTRQKRVEDISRSGDFKYPWETGKGNTNPYLGEDF